MSFDNSNNHDATRGGSVTAQTDAAKALVKAVARAFYNDSCVVVVDMLLRPPYFLRDGPGMGHLSLGLSTKQIRQTFAFLKQEHWVDCEQVQGIVETVSATRTYRRQKTADFWYLDLNRAVHSVRLRLHLLKTRLESQVTYLQTSSQYTCPGYHTGVCNGLYTELEVQHLPVCTETGQFLCQECHETHQHNPEPPPLSSCTLTLVDQSEELRDAETQLRRFQTQMRSYNDGTRQLRPGIFDLLNAVRRETQALNGLPVTSHLPSELGAEDCVAPPPTTRDPEPRDFADEAANEMAGLLRVKGAHGHDVLLDVESAGSTAAAYWARKGGVPFLAWDTHRQTNDDSDDSDDDQKRSPPPPIPDRPSKAPCRQTTPFFLRDNMGRFGNDNVSQRGDTGVAVGGVAAPVDQDGGLAGMVQRTRGLSIEDNDGMEGIFDTESTVHTFPSWVEQDDNNEFQRDTAREIARLLRHDLGGNGPSGVLDEHHCPPADRSGRRMSQRRSHSFPPPSAFFASESSYASVEWE